MTMIGASLLWTGWFGFNAGSALEANNSAALAFINTFLATAGAVLSWTLGEWLLKGKPSMLGAASGAVAGLVAITPAAGNVGLLGAFVIGTVAGLVCLWGVNGLKRMIGVDDTLDVFGVHAVGGILGALLTGIFVSPDLGGPSVVADWVTGKTENPGYSRASSGSRRKPWASRSCGPAWSPVAFKIVDLVIGLRVRKKRSAKVSTSRRTARPRTTTEPVSRTRRKAAARRPFPGRPGRPCGSGPRLAPDPRTPYA